MRQPYFIEQQIPVGKLCEEEMSYPPRDNLPMIGRDMIAYKQCVGTANLYHIYISDEILQPFEYVTMLKTINLAQDTDQFIIHLNSPGGDIDTAIQLVNAISISPAHFTAYIEGLCASAATMIALACDAWVMNPMATFMVHAPTLGSFGKLNEVKESGEYNLKWSRRIFSYTYDGFLTVNEMAECLEHNKDYWFGYDEFMERIYRLADYRKVKSDMLKDGRDPNEVRNLRYDDVMGKSNEPTKPETTEPPVEETTRVSKRVRSTRTSKKSQEE